MRSTDLGTHGFGGWMPFSKVGKSSLIASLPAKPGVYVLRCSTDFARKIGASDILYFGKGTNENGIKNRIRQYFSPGHSQRTNLRLLALIGDCNDYELAFVTTESGHEAIGLEAKLIDLYEADHGELPPENKRR
jgi:excinuclease UvrABC nuclease subunit